MGKYLSVTTKVKTFPAFTNGNLMHYQPFVFVVSTFLSVPSVNWRYSKLCLTQEDIVFGGQHLFAVGNTRADTKLIDVV